MDRRSNGMHEGVAHESTLQGTYLVIKDDLQIG